jgi:hypothetical protein
MTISDLIERLKRIQKDTGSTAQIHIGKLYNNTQERFEFFDLKVKDKTVILMPTDKWDRPNETDEKRQVH